MPRTTKERVNWQVLAKVPTPTGLQHVTGRIFPSVEKAEEAASALRDMRPGTETRLQSTTAPANSGRSA